MSVPRIEHIALNIEIAINAITIANGFNQNLKAVRPKRNDYKHEAPIDGKVLIWQDDEEKNEEAAIETQDWRQPFTLEAIVLDSDASTESIDTRLNKVCADIQKKLLEDVTRGGYAYDTIIMPSMKFDDGEGFSGIAVEVIVCYRTSYLDPYSAA